MNTGKRKVVLIGTGMVGMSFAYALVNQGGICNELVLIDINKKRAEGEAMDLNHGLAFGKTNMRIYAGEYSDCKDADIIVIAAGVAQKEGETRLDLLQRNANVFRSIITPVVKSGFDGIFLVAGIFLLQHGIIFACFGKFAVIKQQYDSVFKEVVFDFSGTLQVYILE